MNCTGYRCNNDLSINYVTSSTSAFNSAPLDTSCGSSGVGEIVGGRHLRSAAPARGDLVVPRTTNKTYGPRSFGMSDQSAWNLLPLAAKDLELTFPAFHNLLKTALFRRAYTTSLECTL